MAKTAYILGGMLRRWALLAAILVLGNAATSAQTAATDNNSIERDTLTVSFITCEPGPQIYELYGHSAIRIQTASGTDIVFNYGMFDFHTPNFVMRFVLGQTDYYMAAFAFGDFIQEYKMRGSKVIVQVLNLSKEEKERLWNSLLRTAYTNGWTYRYNFLYDNCTTRARDEIENCVGGTIEYPADTAKESYRQIVHKYTGACPWSEFGQDLLLGNAADTEISQRQKMFAPLYMAKYNEKAVIVDSAGQRRNLVSDTKIYQPYKEMEKIPGFPAPPLAVFGTILAITLLLCVLQARKSKVFWPIDALLMTVQGVAGCLIATLFFFSEHPTVNSNWLLMVLNPIPLIYMAWRVRCIAKRKFDYYPIAATAWYLLFLIVSAFISQTFSPSVYCFTLTLCLQTATGAYVQNKAKWRKSA